MGTINPERHPQAFIGYLADNGYELDARCPNCAHTARVPSIPLAKRYGYYKNWESLAARLKCRRCGWTRIEVRRVKWSDGVPVGRTPGAR